MIQFVFGEKKVLFTPIEFELNNQKEFGIKFSELKRPYDKDLKSLPTGKEVEFLFLDEESIDITINNLIQIKNQLKDV